TSGRFTFYAAGVPRRRVRMAAEVNGSRLAVSGRPVVILGRPLRMDAGQRANHSWALSGRSVDIRSKCAMRRLVTSRTCPGEKCLECTGAVRVCPPVTRSGRNRNDDEAALLRAADAFRMESAKYPPNTAGNSASPNLVLSPRKWACVLWAW